MDLWSIPYSLYSLEDTSSSWSHSYSLLRLVMLFGIGSLLGNKKGDDSSHTNLGDKNYTTFNYINDKTEMEDLRDTPHYKLYVDHLVNGK